MSRQLGWDVSGAVRLYREGWTLKQLEAEFGQTQSGIWKQLICLGGIHTPNR